MTSIFKKASNWVRRNAWLTTMIGMSALAIVAAHLPERAQAFDAMANGPAIRYSSDVSSTTSIARRSTFTVDLDDLQVNRVSVQVTYSSYQATNCTVFDGRASTISVTIASNTALSGATAFMQITITSNPVLVPATAYISVYITSNSALAGAQIQLIKSTSPDGVHGTSVTLTEGVQWSRNQFGQLYNSPDCSSCAALSLSSAIARFAAFDLAASTPGSSFGWALFPYISTGTAQAESGDAQVVIRALNPGAFANNWFVASSTPGALTVAYSSAQANSYQPPGASSQTAYTKFPMKNGQDGVVITLITNATYTFVAGREFQIGTHSTATALNIANAINFSSYSIVASTNAGAPFFLTTSTGDSQVLVQAITAGLAGNRFQIRSSTQFAATVAITTAVTNSKIFAGPQFFQGGRDPAWIMANGARFTNGVDWFTGYTASNTAFSIIDAFNKSQYTSSTTIFVSTAQMANSPNLSILYATSTFSGAFRYGWASSTQAAMTLSNATTVQVGGISQISTGTMTGGFASNLSTFNFVITATNTLVFCQAVWISTVNGAVPPGRLVVGSTYYVTIASGSGSSDPEIRQRFTLSDTSTGAAQGLPWFTGLSTVSAQGGEIVVLNVSPGRPTPVKFTMAVSNNLAQWVNTPPVVNAASVTVAQTTLQNSTTWYDLGTVNYRYLQFRIDGSSDSVTRFTINVNGKY